jgi:alkanesulfonate monooxygenase SsuD/methylene tetrahydromethanopterin reductase-like flavin-dependent oxidoreductase (luciferase family)
MGGSVDAVLRRIARIGDGWIVSGRPTPEIVAGAGKLQAHVREAGRNPASVGLQGSVVLRDATPEDWQRDLDTWQEVGATHVMVNTMRAGFTSPSHHIAALRRAKEALSLPAR